VEPATLQLAQTVFVGAFVVLLMFSVGLDLSLDSLAHTVRRPLGLLAGALTGYALVPLAGALAASVLDLSAPARAGLMLCAVAPGGPMGAYLALRAQGDVALAAALVLLFNVANTVLIPIGLNIFGVAVDFEGGGYIWPMARTIVLFQILPMAAGLLLHRHWPDQSARLQRVSSTAANVLLAVVGVAVVVLQGQRFVQAGLATILAVEGTVLLSLGLGWLVSPRGRDRRVALAMVGVIHSSSACVLLASTWFKDPTTLLTVLTWAGCMFVTGVVAAWFLRPGAIHWAPWQ